MIVLIFPIIFFEIINIFVNFKSFLWVSKSYCGWIVIGSIDLHGWP